MLIIGGFRQKKNKAKANRKCSKCKNYAHKEKKQFEDSHKNLISIDITHLVTICELYLENYNNDDIKMYSNS
jgi:hypothetical protein